jgi:hypothetical protein
MKKFKVYTNEEAPRSDDMSMGDRLDLINDEINHLLTVVQDSEELDEKVEAVAELINQARFYTSFAVKMDVAQIGDMIEDMKENGIVVSKKKKRN